MSITVENKQSEPVSLSREASEEFVLVIQPGQDSQAISNIPSSDGLPLPSLAASTVSAKQKSSKFRTWIDKYTSDLHLPDLPIPFLKRSKKKKKTFELQSKKRKRADETAYHTLPIEVVAQKFGIDIETGLSSSQSSQLLQQHGRNELTGQEGPSWITVLGKQFLNGLTLILLIALAVSAGLQQWIEAGVIAFIIGSNTVIGFQQEYKAESTMASLRNLSAPKALVLRDGIVQEVSAAEIVVGDVVVLKNGNVVPADLRLFKSKNLHIDESLLTGESEPVEKSVQTIEDSTVGLGDRKNLAFMSTPVTKGRGRGIVIATGMNSEVGEIAQKIAESDKGTSTPLTRKLNQMAYFLFGISLILALVVLAVNSFDFSTEVVLYAVSIAIAMIPEGLVAVVTITMALSVRNMAKQHALVRRMNTLEALGAITDICSDKTGTLTQARMVASELWVLPGKEFKVSGVGFDTSGAITTASSEQVIEELDTPIKEMMLVCALCNNAIVTPQDLTLPEESEQKPKEEAIALGEPTEIALQVLAHKAQMSKEALLQQGWALMEEYPFESAIKRMTSFYSIPNSGEYMGLTKGAPERVIEICDKVYLGNKLVPINQEMNDLFAERNSQMASRGLRVMALAIRTESLILGMTREEVEKEMTFLGFVGIYDPPRVETKDAVKTCIEAGIVVHMVTGDHPATALAIAKQVNIIQDGGSSDLTGDKDEALVITAKQLDQMSDEEIDALSELPRVIARCSPETKVKIIEALHRRNRFVAMTGDGVNDAPALKFADIGVAMGKNGSDVAREASDMILTDDNFTTIVEAIKEGRRIFLNISKFISHLMTGNVAEVIALILGLTVMDATSRSVYILSPLQILWINMVTSSPPAMALGVEPAPRKVMQRPPHTAGLFTLEFLADMMIYGLIMGSITLLSFIITLFVFKEGQIGENCNTVGAEASGCAAVYESRSVPFILLSLMLLFHAFNLKDRRKPLWRINFLNNKVLLAAVALGALVTVPVIYVPTINRHVFVADPITWEWSIIAVGFVSFVLGGELYKAAKRTWWPENKDVRLSSFVKGKTKTLFSKRQTHKEVEQKKVDSILDIEAQSVTIR